MKRPVFVVLLLLLIMAATSALAYEMVTLDGFIYHIDNGVATAVNYDTAADTLIIHARVKGCPVVYANDVIFENMAYRNPTNFKHIILEADVPEWLLYGMPGVTDIAFSAPIKTIPQNGFSAMPDLQRVTLFEGLEAIEYYAFSGCEKLEFISLPNSLKTIQSDAFFGCEALRRVTVAENNPAFQVLEGGLYTRGAQQRLELLFDFEGACFQPAAGTTSLGIGAFGVRNDFSAMVIPQGITAIETGALAYLENLQSLALPKSLTEIEESVFIGCSSLREVTIHPDNPSFQMLEGGLYLRGATQELAMLFDKSVIRFEPAKGTKRINVYAFNLAKQLETITVSEGIQEMEEGIFVGLENLSVLYLPSTLVDAGIASYVYLPNLSRIEVAAGNPVYESRNGVLYKNGAMAYWPVKNSLHAELVFTGDTEPPGLFASNPYIESVSLGYGYKSIPEDTFYSAVALRRAALPLGLEVIGDRAFYNCVALEAITLPPTVKTIGKDAFSNCAKLQSIRIPQGVEAIGEYAFSSCVSLENAVISDSVVEIGTYAFGGCIALESMVIPATVKVLGAGVFQNCRDGFVIYGEEGSAAYNYAFANGILFSKGEEEPYLIHERLADNRRVAIVNLSESGAKTPLYETASTKKPTGFNLMNGTTVFVLSQEGKFAKVEVAGEIGYVLSDALFENETLTNLVTLRWGRRMGGETGAPMRFYETPFEYGEGILIEEDMPVRVLSAVGVWYYGYVNGQLGYIPTNRLQVAMLLDEETDRMYAVVNNPDYHDRLHLRREASTKAGSLGRYYNGTQVEVLDYGDQWCRVRVDGREGYMMSQYLLFISKEQGEWALFGNG